MKVGMPFLLETKTVAEAISLAVELGLDFIELNSNFPNSRVENLSPNELLSAQAESGIEFTLHLDDAISIADLNPFVRQAYLDTTLQAIEFSKITNIDKINIHFAKGNIVTLPDGKHYLFSYYQKEFHSNLRAYRNAVEEAISGYDIQISIENTDGWAEYENVAIELLLESPVFGLCLDIGHDHAVANQDLPFFLKHQDRLIHMHAHDGWDQINHQALGTGVIPIKDRLNLANTVGATVVFETKTIEALRTSVAWFKDNFNS